MVTIGQSRLRAVLAPPIIQLVSVWLGFRLRAADRKSVLATGEIVIPATDVHVAVSGLIIRTVSDNLGRWLSANSDMKIRKC